MSCSFLAQVETYFCHIFNIRSFNVFFSLFPALSFSFILFHCHTVRLVVLLHRLHAWKGFYMFYCGLLLVYCTLIIYFHLTMYPNILQVNAICSALALML